MKQTLHGEKVRIRGYDDADFGLYWELLHDEAVFSNMGTSEPTEAAARAKMLSLSNKDDALVCTIETREGGEFVGVTSLLDITREHRRAKIAMTMVKPGCRGLGYARDARLTLYRYAFDRLGLCTLYGFVFTDNERNKQHLESIGFKALVMIPKWGVRNGSAELQDEFLMVLSKDRFVE